MGQTRGGTHQGSVPTRGGSTSTRHEWCLCFPSCAKATFPSCSPCSACSQIHTYTPLGHNQRSHVAFDYYLLWHPFWVVVTGYCTFITCLPVLNFSKVCPHLISGHVLLFNRQYLIQTVYSNCCYLEAYQWPFLEFPLPFILLSLQMQILCLSQDLYSSRCKNFFVTEVPKSAMAFSYLTCPKIETYTCF